MNEEIIKYRFKENAYYCSEEGAGVCYLLIGDKIVIESNEEIKSYNLPFRIDKAYVLNSKEILAIVDSSKYDCSDDHFKFSTMILNLEDSTLKGLKEYTSCDLRGVIINVSEKEIVLTTNRYSFDFSKYDPDELYCEPPMSTHAICSDIMYFDFDLKKKREKVFDKDLPDDLVLHVSSLGKKDSVVDFVSGQRWSSDGIDITAFYPGIIKLWGSRILCKRGHEFYLIDDHEIFKWNELTLEAEPVLILDKCVINIFIELKDELPEIRIYYRTYKKILSVPNSIKFLMR